MRLHRLDPDEYDYNDIKSEELGPDADPDGMGSYMGEFKCGGCGWEVVFLYVLADNARQARELYLDGHAGLCGNCMCDILSECEYIIDHADVVEEVIECR